jgi:predicted membrane-bound spermidine synthase
MKNWYLFVLSFLEGALVLTVELCGTKMLSPIVGSTVYVWSCMLSVTLFSLAAGYFTGGILSRRVSRIEKVQVLMMLSAICTILIPFIVQKIFLYFGELPFKSLLLVETSATLFIPLFCLGCVSPLLISELNSNKENMHPASRIFSVSTFGGVFAGLILAFVMITAVGVEKGLVFFSMLPVVLISFMNFIKVVPYTVIYILLIISIYVYLPANGKTRYEQLYHSNGILGDVRVVRFAMYDSAISNTPSTWVFVNNISQSMYDPGAREKFFTYAYRLDTLFQDLKPHSKVLLCGMGGGSMLSILKDDSLDIKVCELDPRMPYVAKNFFGIDFPIDVSIDDARHFIRTSKEKYDAVIMDIFRGEETPSHVLSIEGLDDLKKIINPDAKVFINSHGYLTGTRGDGNRAIYKTLKAAGFKVTAEFTDPTEEKSNILFLCSMTEKIPSTHEIPAERFDIDEPVLTDKIPRLEKLNRQAGLAWRSEAKTILFLETRSSQ